MLRNKITLFSVLVVAIGISVAAFLVVFKGEAQTQQNDNKLEAKVLRKGNSNDTQLTKKELDDAATPIVDYDNPNAEPASSARFAKNARYDGRRFGAIPSSFQSAESITFWEFPSDLPIAESDLIVEGKVTDSAAYLSNDKGIVYSEFTFRVSDIVKADANITVNKNDSIVTERIGGRVKYPDGRMTRVTALGQGSPMKGKKYLLFLTKVERENYRILTGYELQGNKVFALDGSQLTRRPQAEWVFGKHNGKDYRKFKDELEKAKDDPANSNQNRRVLGP
jgi:lipopolysaccharide export LptBFGC system permease protein LptF